MLLTIGIENDLIHSIGWYKMEIRWRNHYKKVNRKLVEYYSQTVIGGGRIECFILIRMPWYNTDKVSDKRWNFTFQNSRITSNDIGFIDIGIVKLTDDWLRETKTKTKSKHRKLSDKICGRFLFRSFFCVVYFFEVSKEYDVGIKMENPR